MDYLEGIPTQTGFFLLINHIFRFNIYSISVSFEIKMRMGEIKDSTSTYE